jgi:hypothetical protein
MYNTSYHLTKIRDLANYSFIIHDYFWTEMAFISDLV